MYVETTAVHKLAKLRKRVRGIAGGTSASKTISILSILIHQAQTDKSPTLTSVTSESMPHLKRGAMRDFLSIMETQEYYDEDAWNRTDFIYTFPSGSRIEFFSLDMPHKVRGPRRQRLFINEANNIPFETYTQLEIRTSEEIWLDWNPTNEFWFYTELMNLDYVDFLILTYKDNEGLEQAIVDSIESRKDNKSWWRVYGQGMLGEVEGKVFTGWQFIKDIPHEARLERRGLDFGYSNDPTSIMDIYKYNGGFILDEQMYRKGMTNKQIADFISNLEKPETIVFADSSEPKSIDELHLFGVNVLPAFKGPASVNRGIDYIRDQKVSVTERSTNTIKEYRNYMWMTDKDGRILNKPMDEFNHSMDAVRYGLETYSRSINSQAGVVNAVHPEDRVRESFIVNEHGDAPGLHYNIGEALSKQKQEDY